MGLINLNYVIPGEEVTDESVNRQTRSLAHQLNGNINTDNLSDGAVTTAKIADGAITADCIDFSTLAFGNYSLTESNTGFTWVDGKPIYKKTVDIGAFSGMSDKTVAHGITGISAIIELSGFAKDSSSSIWFPLPYVRAVPSNMRGIQILANATDILILRNDDYDVDQCYVTLRYTKA